VRFSRAAEAATTKNKHIFMLRGECALRRVDTVMDTGGKIEVDHKRSFIVSFNT
jgi:hypothetical protein